MFVAEQFLGFVVKNYGKDSVSAADGSLSTYASS
jgi:hypothetical protein